jgi:hypothetical protein
VITFWSVVIHRKRFDIFQLHRQSRRDAGEAVRAETCVGESANGMTFKHHAPMPLLRWNASLYHAGGLRIGRQHVTRFCVRSHLRRVFRVVGIFASDQHLLISSSLIISIITLEGTFFAELQEFFGILGSIIGRENVLRHNQTSRVKIVAVDELFCSIYRHQSDYLRIVYVSK